MPLVSTAAKRMVSSRSVDAASLAELGILPVDTDRPARLVISIEGDEGTGKTSLALSAPGPIVIFDIDRNLEGVVSRYGGVKDIKVMKLEMAKVLIGTETTATALDGMKEFHEEQWLRFKKAFTAVVGRVRTVIIDSGTDLNILLRMAKFGKAEQIPPNLYNVVNAEWASLFNYARDQKVSNLVITHKTAEEWEDKIDDRGRKISRPTGRKITQFWKGVPYAVQARIGLRLDKSGFWWKVVRGVDDPGKELEISGDEFPLPKDGSFEQVAYALTGIFEGWDK